MKAHWGAIAGMDCFTVQVVTLTGLIRNLVLVVMDHKTRRVEIAGIVRQPDGRWMNQVARNLTDVCEGFLRDGYYVLHDRDRLFTAQFRNTLAAVVAMAVRLPAKSPDLNAHAERFVRSIKEECINRVVPLGERHLRTVVREHMIHYHEERNHPSLDNQLIRPMAEVVRLDNPINRRERLGGLLNCYHREVA